MKTVTIRSSSYYNRELSGVFPFVGVINGDKYCSREVYLRIVRDGKEINVHANRSDFDVEGVTQLDNRDVVIDSTPELTDEEIYENIESRFRIMESMAEGVVDGTVRSLIITAAAGVGKTHSLEKRLSLALNTKEISKLTHIKGKITPLSLYIALYQHSAPGQVILFDDVDSVFADEVTLNLLKGALDTGRRNLSWMSTSKILEENDIPQSFEFEGSCVFITNIDFDAKIAKGASDSVHYKALISRSNYLDLMVHTNKEILIRVKQVIEKTTIIEDNGLDESSGKEIIDWLDANFEKMREISIRSVLKLASYMKVNGDSWQEMAKVMLLKK